MFQTKVVEKIKTHILCAMIYFLLEIVPFMRQAKKYRTGSQTTDDNMAHVHFMLDT
jgi:hypothetical protein